MLSVLLWSTVPSLERGLRASKSHCDNHSVLYLPPLSCNQPPSEVTEIWPEPPFPRSGAAFGFFHGRQNAGSFIKWDGVGCPLHMVPGKRLSLVWTGSP